MAEDTVVDILHQLLPEAEALCWLHEGLADIITKLNAEAPASLRFYVSMDAYGSLHLQCDRQDPQAPAVETMYNVVTPYNPFGPAMEISANLTIGRFSIEDDGIFFCIDDQYNSRGQMFRFEVRVAADIERVAILAMRRHWARLLGMVSHGVYGEQYTVPSEAMLVEQEEEMCAEDVADEETESLGHLVLEPRLREW